MPNQNTKKPYNPTLCFTNEFFIPHKDANHLNAQDVVCDLIARTKDISTATFNCFKDGNKLVIKDEIVANLVYEIQSKLEMIEKILPLAFQSEGV